VLHGPVESLTRESDRVRVRVSSAPPLVAEVTAASARRLGLSEGHAVHASFKAVEVTLVLPE
jgi:molybdopterin-binding protein